MLEIVYRYDPDQADQQDRPADAAEAVMRLVHGNEQFAGLWATDASESARQEVIPFDASRPSTSR